ncbi:MAG: hypothetical protein K2K46_13060 [Lachnospiraceae bacterium]|nr:hypothetical protein [Lachnospiraceae bacterium]
MAGYNYGYNRKNLEDEFSEMEGACREAGMSEDRIKEIHRLLLDQLNSDRRYYTHTFSYDGLKFPNGDESGVDNNPLMKTCLNQFNAIPIEISDWRRTVWIEDLDSDEIIAWARALDEDDFQMITFLAVDCLNQTEIAKMWGVTVPAISKRKKRLAKELAQILPEWLKERYIY